MLHIATAPLVAQARYFFLRLPIVTHEASPWYPYLLAVYHTDSVPLPFDLRTRCTGQKSNAYRGQREERPQPKPR